MPSLVSCGLFIDESTLALGYSSGAVSIWHQGIPGVYSDGQRGVQWSLEASLTGCSSPCVSLCMLGDGRTLIAGHASGTLHSFARTDDAEARGAMVSTWTTTATQPGSTGLEGDDALVKLLAVSGRKDSFLCVNSRSVLEYRFHSAEAAAEGKWSSETVASPNEGCRFTCASITPPSENTVAVALGASSGRVQFLQSSTNCETPGHWKCSTGPDTAGGKAAVQVLALSATLAVSSHENKQVHAWERTPSGEWRHDCHLAKCKAQSSSIFAPLSQASFSLSFGGEKLFKCSKGGGPDGGAAAADGGAWEVEAKYNMGCKPVFMGVIPDHDGMLLVGSDGICLYQGLFSPFSIGMQSKLPQAGAPGAKKVLFQSTKEPLAPEKDAKATTLLQYVHWRGSGGIEVEDTAMDRLLSFLPAPGGGGPAADVDTVRDICCYLDPKAFDTDIEHIVRLVPGFKPWLLRSAVHATGLSRAACSRIFFPETDSPALELGLENAVQLLGTKTASLDAIIAPTPNAKGSGGEYIVEEVSFRLVEALKPAWGETLAGAVQRLRGVDPQLRVSHGALHDLCQELGGAAVELPTAAAPSAVASGVAAAAPPAPPAQSADFPQDMAAEFDPDLAGLAVRIDADGSKAAVTEGGSEASPEAYCGMSPPLELGNRYELVVQPDTRGFSTVHVQICGRVGAGDSPDLTSGLVISMSGGGREKPMRVQVFANAQPGQAAASAPVADLEVKCILEQAAQKRRAKARGPYFTIQVDRAAGQYSVSAEGHQGMIVAGSLQGDVWQQPELTAYMSGSGKATSLRIVSSSMRSLTAEDSLQLEEAQNVEESDGGATPAGVELTPAQRDNLKTQLQLLLSMIKLAQDGGEELESFRDPGLLHGEDEGLTGRDALDASLACVLQALHPPTMEALRPSARDLKVQGDSSMLQLCAACDLRRSIRVLLGGAHLLAVGAGAGGDAEHPSSVLQQIASGNSALAIRMVKDEIQMMLGAQQASPLLLATLEAAAISPAVILDSEKWLNTVVPPGGMSEDEWSKQLHRLTQGETAAVLDEDLVRLTPKLGALRHLLHCFAQLLANNSNLRVTAAETLEDYLSRTSLKTEAEQLPHFLLLVVLAMQAMAEDSQESSSAAVQLLRLYALLVWRDGLEARLPLQEIDAWVRKPLPRPDDMLRSVAEFHRGTNHLQRRTSSNSMVRDASDSDLQLLSAREQWRQLVDELGIPLEKQRAMNDLMSLVGMEEVKKQALQIFTMMYAAAKLDARNCVPVRLNFTFMGSPGTGKTTAAKLFGRLLFDAGARSRAGGSASGEPVFIVKSAAEIKRDGAQAFAEALNHAATGGVLFIDEAYQLEPATDPVGRAVVDELLMAAELHREKLTIILAGYKDQIETKLYAHNSGIASRFKEVHFPDFTNEQLGEIFTRFLKEAGWQAKGNTVRNVLVRRIARTRDSKNFGNARDVREAWEAAYIAAMQRQRGALKPVCVLHTADVMGPSPTEHERPHLRECMKQLRGMYGLQQVKREIELLLEGVKTNYTREQHGHPVEALPIHRILAGNPGTGKTTVAHLYASILKEVGILSNGTLENRQAGQLLDRDVPSTREAVHRLLDLCRGKVLAIDNAHELMSSAKGRAALHVLVQHLSGHEGEDIAVLLVGTSIEQLRKLANENPKLGRLFNKDHMLEFSDYNNTTLAEMVLSECDAGGIQCPAYTLEVIVAALQQQRSRGGFRNAAAVKLLVQNAIKQMLREKEQGTLTDGSTLSEAHVFSVLPGGKALHGAAGSGAAAGAAASSPRSALDVASDLHHQPQLRPAVEDMHNALQRDPSCAARFRGWLITGPSGSGKKHAAARMGEILHVAGVVTNNYVHTIRACELASSDESLSEAVQRCLSAPVGGVLCIQSLASLKGVQPRPAAVADALAAAMSESRTAVVLLGEAAEVEDLLRNSSQLAESLRNRVSLNAWTSDQASDFAREFVQQQGYVLAPNSHDVLSRGFGRLVRTPAWASARDVKAVVEASIAQLTAQQHEDVEACITIGADELDVGFTRLLESRGVTDEDSTSN